MKSIKPGRGPSAMGAVGSIMIGMIGVAWTAGAASMGAPPFFLLFGIVFIGLAVMQAVFHFKNATGANRMSIYDITDSRHEPDPLERYVKPGSTSFDRTVHEAQAHKEVRYCPYCGTEVASEEHLFCTQCGKPIK